MGQACAGRLCGDAQIGSTLTLTEDVLIQHEIRSRKESGRSSRSAKSTTLVLSTHAQKIQSFSNFSPSELISRRIREGEVLCKNNAIVRRAFVLYILSHVWKEEIVADVREEGRQKRRTPYDAQEINFNEYSIRSRGSSTDSRDVESVAQTMMRLKVRDSMSIGSNGSSRRRGEVETCFSSAHMRSLLAASLWPLFVQTAACERALAGDSENAVYPAEDEMSNRDSQRSASDKVRRLQTIYLRACPLSSKDDLDLMLLSGAWVDDVLQCIERLLLSVSISKVCEVTNTFPMVYVNSAFESTTLFPRSEVVGSRESFLVCPATEPDQLTKLQTAMLRAEPIKIAITNGRKDGSTFLNFLAARPVYLRESGMYTYVLCVQYDANKAESSLKEIKMVGDALAVLSTVLKG